MKELYEIAEIEVVKFSIEDIITTSPTDPVATEPEPTRDEDELEEDTDI